jgi:hypothetical protein
MHHTAGCLGHGRRDRRSRVPVCQTSNNSGGYSVRVCAPRTGHCAYAPVWDVGPWNTTDDYWNPAGTRQSWTDLPQGLPRAQAAYEDDYNAGSTGSAARPPTPPGSTSRTARSGTPSG